MPKFLIKAEATTYYEGLFEADSEDDAVATFMDGNWDDDDMVIAESEPTILEVTEVKER